MTKKNILPDTEFDFVLYLKAFTPVSEKRINEKNIRKMVRNAKYDLENGHIINLYGKIIKGPNLGLFYRSSNIQRIYILSGTAFIVTQNSIYKILLYKKPFAYKIGSLSE